MLIADSVLLLSVYKPLLLAAMTGCWAWTVTWLDKDMAMFHLRRQLWNGLFVVVGVFSLWLWLTLPFFWLGLLLAVTLNAGLFVGYHFYRNKHVPEERQWSISLDPFRTRLEAYQHAQAQKAASIKLIAKDGSPVDVPVHDDPLVPIHAALAQLLDFALPRRASRLDIVTDTSTTKLLVHIDGVTYPQPDIEPALGLGVTDYLKHHAGMDVQDRRRKQKGTLKVDADIHGRHALHLTTSGNNRGVALSIEIDPGRLKDRKLDELGLLESQLAQLVPALDEPGRVVIVTASPGQGLTTTLYTLAGRHDPYTQSVVAMEESFDIELEGVTYEPIKTGGDAPSMAQQMTTLMLREPNVLLLGNLSDPDTAKVLLKYAREVRFYLGLRQGDAMLGLRAWMQAAGDAKQAAGVVSAVITQRLIRRVCHTCRLAYKPDVALLKKLNLSPEKVTQFYKHSGQVLVKNQPQVCPDCLGIGYQGRLAVFEAMVLDDEARALAAASQFDALRTHLRKGRMILLQEAALAKVVQGQTTISEITRVLGNK